jgi:hypothetical protein
MLNITKSEIVKYAGRYEYPNNEQLVLDLIPRVKKNGYLGVSELYTILRWKSHRIAGHAKNNTEDYAKEITSFALSADEERSRIETLTLLDGVAWPAASVILHFFHKDRYPILDYRALWSIGMEKPSQYTFQFWWDYVKTIREISDSLCLDMRTIDRGLWQFSKEFQSA